MPAGSRRAPDGAMDASRRDPTVPQLKGWAGGPRGLWGGGIPLPWCPTGCVWDGQCSSIGVPRELCSRGCFSSGCGAPWSLELTGICGPSCAPQGPVGQGQAALGPSWRRPMCPPGVRRSGDAPAAWPQHVGMHLLGKRAPGNFLGISQGELGSGNFLPSPFSPPSSLTHCSRGHKRL